MAACTTSDLPLVQGLAASVDCNVDGLVASAYQALIGPGSEFQWALTALMTLYVGFLGLRIMLGLSPLRIGELTITAAKLGVVLALATSWPTYQALVVGVLYDGPQDIAARILGGASGSAFAAPYEGLQTVFDEMQAASTYYAARTPGAASPFVGGAGFGAFATNAASMIMLLSTLGVILASKIVLTALLAAGPLFVALFLFDATRGVFLGWLRAVIALALAPLFALVALIFQLLLVQPQLETLTRMRAANGVDIAPAIATLSLTGITAFVSLAGLIALGFIAASLNFQRRTPLASAAEPRAGAPQETAPAALYVAAAATNAGQPRSAAIAAAASAMDRRDLRLSADSLGPRFAMAGGLAQPASAFLPTPAVSGPRRGPDRFRSASAARRDR